MDRYSWDDEDAAGTTPGASPGVTPAGYGARPGFSAGPDPALSSTLLTGRAAPAPGAVTPSTTLAGPRTATRAGTAIGVGAVPGLDRGVGGESAASLSAKRGFATQPGPAAGAADTRRGVDMGSLAQRAQSLASIADPAAAARERDAVSREVSTSLQQAGHKVSWKGETLMVDGRPYVVAGAAPRTAAAGAAPMSTADPLAARTPGAAATQAAQAPAYTYGGVIDPGKQYDPNEAFAHVQTLFKERWNREPSKEEIDALAKALGYTGGPIAGDKVKQAIAWLEKYSGNLSDPWGEGAGGPGPGGGGAPAPPGTGTPEWRAEWAYDPGEITFDDLDGFDMDSLMGRLGGAVPVGQSGTDRQTEDLISSLLANPETMNPAMVDALKARSKDELAEMGAMEDAALRDFGYDAGITDSNWLRSERLASTRDRQNALMSKNRDIDIDAAHTNAEDRRRAAEMGMAFSDQRFGQVLASRQEERQAIQLASDTGLRAAALNNDRMALREQINAKAAELGLDADRVALQYTLGLMDDLTKRYGIDVSKDLDLKKLASADRNFKDDLALKFAQLKFQYDELAKRDDWAQLDAGVRLATTGLGGGYYDQEYADRHGGYVP